MYQYKYIDNAILLHTYVVVKLQSLNLLVKSQSLKTRTWFFEFNYPKQIPCIIFLFEKVTKRMELFISRFQRCIQKVTRFLLHQTAQGFSQDMKNTFYKENRSAYKSCVEWFKMGYVMTKYVQERHAFCLNPFLTHLFFLCMLQNFYLVT